MGAWSDRNREFVERSIGECAWKSEQDRRGLIFVQKIIYEVTHERNIDADIHSSPANRTWIHSLAFKETKKRPGR